jgi:peroxiredoxin
MKYALLLAILLLSFTFATAQNEQAPVVEKEIKYKDWTYKNVLSGDSVNLRDLTRGKKLVMVVYFAAWCPNWKHQAPFTQKLYDKYRASGLGIVGVAEYDTIDNTKASMNNFKITFPVVGESESRDDVRKTLHYDYRRYTGDARKWGSPWNIFLQPALLEQKGDVLVKKAFVVNGELIEADAEKFVREKLGLPAEVARAELSKEQAPEVCEPERKTPQFIKPN